MPPFLIPLISPLLNKVLDFIPDPAKKAEAALQAEKDLRDAEAKAMALIASQNEQQANIDAEEAKSSSLFIAGWRPALGWTCSAAFAWVYVLQPITTFILTVCRHPVALPTLDFSTMSTVLMGMLGLAGLRTYEKRTDSESNR